MDGWRLVFLGLAVIFFVNLLTNKFMFGHYFAHTDRDRCQAAQQTILDEAELIAAGGKFPGEQVTDRWKKLLGGCQ